MFYSQTTRAVLAVSLLLLSSAAIPLSGAASTAGNIVNARSFTTYTTIQAAINGAQPGDTITVPMNASGTAYAESLTIPATLTGLRLCSTVAVAVCAPVSQPGRWEITNTASTTWGDPPVAWQGQAIKIVGVGSTSHYPNSVQPAAPKLKLSDVAALSFDMMLESGTCGGGSPRLQIGVNTTGGSVKDGSVLVYPPAGWTCPTAGQWTHLNMIDGVWDSIIVGGPTAGTRAQAFAAGGNASVITYNLIWDGSPGVAWFDNVRFNDAFLREQTDTTCADPTSPSCTTAVARGSTIIDPAGTAGNVITVLAAGVTVQGFTIKNTGSILAGDAVALNGANANLNNNTITGNGVPRQFDQFGVVAQAPGVTISDNDIQSWSHTGVTFTGAASGTNLLAHNVITKSGHSNVLVMSSSPGGVTTILGNDLRAAGSQSIDIATVRDVVVRENVFGLAPNTLAFPHDNGSAIDARYNHWGAYNRSNIEATFANDIGRVVDDSCYYTVNDTSVVCGPTAGFTFAPSSPVWKRAVNFTDASTQGGNAIVSRAWSFGDNASSTVTSPAHAYASSGTFVAKLTTKDAEGFTSSATQTLTVTNAAPTLAAIAPIQSVEGALLTFTLQGADANGDALTYTATSLPSGATLNAATGVFSWTPDYTQSGIYAVSFRATDGEKLSAPQTATLNITDGVPPAIRPTTITLASSASLLEGTTRSIAVRAVNPDGAAITLSASGLPAWASFADNGNGNGTLLLAPAVGDAGSVNVTITAVTVGTQNVSASTAITVVPRAAVTLTTVGDRAPVASPGETLTLVANVTNTGPHADTFTLRAVTPSGATTLTPISLNPGESQNVSFTLVVPQGVAAGAARLTATSSLNPAVSATTAWAFTVPVTVNVTLAKATFSPLDSISGTVTATFANGSPAPNAAVKLTQGPAGFGVLATSTSGHTNASGAYAFDFGIDAQSRLPGNHDLLVVVVLNGVATPIRLTYTVSQ